MKNKFLALVTICLSTSIFAKDIQHQNDNEIFTQFANQYFDHYYLPFHPTTATQLGIHTYDDKMENYSKDGMARELSALKEYERQLIALPTHDLDEQTQGDYELVLNDIRSRILTLETIQPLSKNPDAYSSGITTSAFTIIERNFASSTERLKSLIAREKLMPGILDNAHVNLHNPPQIYTEIALEQIPGLINFFQKDVPTAFKNVTDKKLKQEFAISNNAVINALTNYQTWLKTELLPKSHGDFRIGADAFRKKLKYDEMVDLPLDQLLAINMENMQQNQKEFARIAKELYPEKTPQEVLNELSKEHPAPRDLLKTFQDNFTNLIEFINTKQIATILSDKHPIMQETPPFMRAWTLASMDPPGAFENNDRVAYFNVTLPDPSWPKDQVESFMQHLSYPMITSIAIHEAYPGHYVQLLWMQKWDDRVRKILLSNTNVEGWAHYCEQMMLDEGYGKQNDREAKVLRLGQLLHALLRNARFIVSIKMHTADMTFDQAVDVFVKDGYQPHATAVVEAKRGTTDPTYLYYTLGKLEILKLRADMQKKLGNSFKLLEFHDEFMHQGGPPIKIVRKAMLHDDSPVL